MYHVPLMVMANKQDQSESRRSHEVATELGLNRLTNREWRIRGTCATSGDGVYESIVELSELVKNFQREYRK